MFRRESQDNPRRNAKRALEQIDVLRSGTEGRVTMWERMTTGVGRSSGGSGITAAVVAFTDQAFYLSKGAGAVATSRVPLGAIALADVSLWRPGFVRLELVGRDEEVDIAACASGDDHVTVVSGNASEILASEPFIIFHEGSGEFLRQLGLALSARQ